MGKYISNLSNIINKNNINIVNQIYLIYFAANTNDNFSIINNNKTTQIQKNNKKINIENEKIMKNDLIINNTTKYNFDLNKDNENKTNK